MREFLGPCRTQPDPHRVHGGIGGALDAVLIVIEVVVSGERHVVDRRGVIYELSDLVGHVDRLGEVVETR